MFTTFVRMTSPRWDPRPGRLSRNRGYRV